jgi:hypothetical protein
METIDHGLGVTTDTDSMHGVVKQDGKIVKKFHGETAWMDAERYARDLATKIRYA